MEKENGKGIELNEVTWLICEGEYLNEERRRHGSCKSHNIFTKTEY